MYNWDTEFNTAENQMIHTFENGVSVITDFNFNTVYVFRHNEKIAEHSLESTPMAEDYAKFLVNTSKQAASCSDFQS